MINNRFANLRLSPNNIPSINRIYSVTCLPAYPSIRTMPYNTYIALNNLSQPWEIIIIRTSFAQNIGITLYQQSINFAVYIFNFVSHLSVVKSCTSSE